MVFSIAGPGTELHSKFVILVNCRYRLQPSVKNLNQLLKDGDYVGYQTKSFVQSLLMHRNFPEEKLIAYNSADDYAKALRNGSKNGGVSAIVDEVPYLEAFLSDPKYKEEFEIEGGQIFRTPGFGFVSCSILIVLIGSSFKRKSHVFNICRNKLAILINNAICLSFFSHLGIQFMSLSTGE